METKILSRDLTPDDQVPVLLKNIRDKKNQDN